VRRCNPAQRQGDFAHAVGRLVPGTRIRDNADFERHVDYIHFNPVKHGYVTRVCDWPYSSFHRYLQNGLLPADWGGDQREIQGRFGSNRGVNRVRKIARTRRAWFERLAGRFCAPYEAEIACYYFGPPK
jgi:putative transposase